MNDRFLSLKQSEIEQLHEKSLHVLSKTGVNFLSESALNLFRQHGFKIDGCRVYFSAAQVESATENVPHVFTLLARNSNKNIEVGGNDFHFAPSGGAPFTMESDGRYRPATFSDRENFFKLTQHYDIIAFNRGVVVPQNINSKDSSIICLQRCIELTEKPYQIDEKRHLDMVRIAFGATQEAMQNNYDNNRFYGLGATSPGSPLFYDQSQAEKIINLAKLMVPNVIASAGMAGTTAPCTLPAVLITQNCENLSGIILSQLAQPGAPVVYGTISTISNMRSCAIVLGAPEARILECAASKLAQFYGIPSRGDFALTDSFASDYQAGAEAMMQAFSAVNSGIHLLPGCGELGSWMYGSIEKFVLDCEVAAYVKRAMQPICIDDESCALDVIDSVGPQSTFLLSDHTLDHFRTEFLSENVFVRSNYDAWNSSDRKDVILSAKQEAQTIISEFHPPYLDPQSAKDIEKLVTEFIS